MANNVIANDVTYGYRNGGTQDGTPTLSGTATDFTCRITSHNESYTAKTVSQAGICATDDQALVTRYNGTETFTMMVPSTGFVFKAMKGNYIEITEQVLALTAEVRVGVITGWSKGFSDDGNVTETITITYGVAGV